MTATARISLYRSLHQVCRAAHVCPGVPTKQTLLLGSYCVPVGPRCLVKFYRNEDHAKGGEAFDLSEAIGRRLVDISTLSQTSNHTKRLLRPRRGCFGAAVTGRSGRHHGRKFTATSGLTYECAGFSVQIYRASRMMKNGGGPVNRLRITR